MLAYVVKFTPDDNDTILVTCPSLPEVTTFGDDEQDAAQRAETAIEEALAARIAAGLDIPPTRVTNKGPNVVLPTMTSLKVELYRAARQQGVTRAELVRKLTALHAKTHVKIHREQVDRLFRLDHASRMDQIDDAFRALGRKLNVTVEPTA